MENGECHPIYQNLSHPWSQAIHYQCPSCDINLFPIMKKMQCASDYTYMGCWFNEFLIHNRPAESLTAAMGRSVGRKVNIFKHMGDMGHNICCTLCVSYVLPAACCAAGIWGFADFSAPRVLQNRMGRFFLGTDRYDPSPALWMEMDWLNMRREREVAIQQVGKHE